MLMLVSALLGRWLVDSYARDAAPLATMYIAVAFSVWFGGWRPAATVALVGFTLALWWFVPPRHTFKSWETFGIVRTALYFLSCSITIFLCESLRRAQRRHALAETKATSILETMQDCFCAVDGSWRIVQVNRSTERSLGTARETLLTRTLWEMFPATRGTPTESQLQHAKDEKITMNFETNSFIAGARHAVTAVPSGNGMAIFFQDITVQRAHLDQLERLVDDRTAKLQRLVSELEAFSYTLVHDIRAPLRAISGFAEILAEDHTHQLDAAGKAHVARIRRSAVRMDQLIVDILDYSQLSKNKPELHGVNLDCLLREILAAHPEFQSDKADITIAGNLPTVRGNEVLLTQCFSNLLHNATKFVAPGVKPAIQIGAQAEGDISRVNVTDNGIGIAPEAMARIFEPFRRENPHYDGTGIGLAIVRKVVEQLDGRVGVESELGQGSRFWVELKTEDLAPSQGTIHSTKRVLV
jgi:PAS domain S-box-containing protein